ncbi:unnamed protein product [Phyllotreta striolata]|uniref:BHLH domain-containing protein n=1 Tax=Phyllotreta striolata TaxID=444603 RepID=A0A9N9XW72_PHYSR|nr:unnamed protein product [Phyllotreta striolata]
MHHPNSEGRWDCVGADGIIRAEDKRPLREKNPCKHVPHKERAPQVVARRNARERRRVQAVNMAFVRLKKAIPYQNSRGKRISKVKTLQNAIRYIQELEIILRNDYLPGYHYFTTISPDFTSY